MAFGVEVVGETFWASGSMVADLAVMFARLSRIFNESANTNCILSGLGFDGAQIEGDLLCMNIRCFVPLQCT